MLDTVGLQRLLALHGAKGIRAMALVPIVRRSSSHDAFLHCGGCGVLDTAVCDACLHLYGARGIRDMALAL